MADELAQTIQRCNQLTRDDIVKRLDEIDREEKTLRALLRVKAHEERREMADAK